MKNVSYSAVDREVVVTDASTGNVCWHGAPEDAPVVDLVSIPGTSDAVVLLDYMSRQGSFENVVRIGPDGVTQWRAELPTGEPTEAYVELAFDYDQSRLVARSWTGHRVVLDLGSGEIVERDFVK